ncbi:GrpB family protein [Hujiaoplasma nucleasis]|uniref:GrpB family protein n=1 Tax=Hujiaoplasma nucleasis TaxID=2725268 RepID=A0A7L6N333_9MOLU|nr:GrpB family protein [Hujiaoplasma nucleasis]QLY40680.1 GrpB family protein [Hujiaoplasma nucleasis]
MSLKLKEMSKEELWHLFPIILKEHNPDYKNWYEEEKKKLISMIGKDKIQRINHIGSTSVHGLIAKPTIDILIEVENEQVIHDIKEILNSDEYICLEQKDVYKNPAIFCMKGYSENGFAEKVYHIHIKIINNHKELYFRDYLQSHPEVANKYGDLKIQLLKKYKHHRDNYTDNKTEFVQYYTSIARSIYPNRYKPKK